MRVLFITQEPRLYSMQRFAEACQSAGHTFASLDPLATSLVLESAGAQVWSGGEPVSVADTVVVPRVGTAITEQGCALVAQFEAMGVACVNGAEAVLRARDKLRSLQLLAAASIPTPRTVVVRSAEDLEHALIQVGGLPCVLKLLRGTQGIGVMLAESPEGLEAMMQAFWSLGHTVLLQEFIHESKGKDIRALVVGDKVVAAMQREARVGEFRSNIHRGGRGTMVRLSKADEQVVLRAARVLGLEVAGVDFLESRNGPRVIEVNASPGFQGLEQATGADIAGAIVAHAVRKRRAEAPL